jgi:hypothetical protein
LPEPELEDGAEDPEVDGAGVEGEDAEGDDGGDAPSPEFFVSRGGASELSIPTGVVSACRALFPVSDPAGTYAPVASHGTDAFAALLCNAAPMVNKPCELPVCSAS